MMKPAIFCKQIIFSCCLLFTPFIVKSQQLSSSLENDIKAIFNDWNLPDKPGAAVAVVQNGAVLYSNGFGSADIEHQTPITPSTKFQLQSLQNQVIAFAVLLLEADGKLSLDDDIRKYLPEMPDLGKPISIHNLLTHTHGLPDFIIFQLLSGWNMEDRKTKEQALKLLYNTETNLFDAGDEYNYCISGFLLAAEIVEKVSGMSFADFTKEKIFEPLNMNNTTFEDSQNVIQNRSRPYRNVGEKFKNAALDYYILSDLNLYSTVEDMAQWMLNFETGKVGNAAVLKKMDTPIKLNDGSTSNSVLGQFVAEYKGLNKIEQSGMAYGNLAHIIRFPQQNFGVVVLGNAYNFNAQEAALKITDLLLKEKLKEEVLPEESIENPSVRKNESISLTTTELQKFCGAYWNANSFYSRKIYLKEDKLYYWRSEGNESELTPTTKNTFVLSASPEYSVRFEKDGDKDMMIFVIGNSEFEYPHEKYEPVTYNSDQLKDFTGAFFCENLGTSYHLKLVNGQLQGSNIRKADFPVTPYKTDKLTSNLWYFSNLEFVRDSQNKIEGFWLKDSNVGKLYFRKI